MIFASLQTVQCQNHHANQWQQLFHLSLESFSLTHHNPIRSHQTFTLHNVLNAATLHVCNAAAVYVHISTIGSTASPLIIIDLLLLAQKQMVETQSL